ncbi:hypothetical protein PUG81_11450 [Erwiniaceae bacterium L1_54_6]|nr:hypothetical protein [Erwiniaceae bacterium L1_54_6]
MFFLIGFLHIYANFVFKRNKNKNDDFLDEYEQAGLQLDLTTKVSNHMGFYANYQKLSFFMRLYRGERMLFSRNEFVRKEAYDFVQKQSKDKIGWMKGLLNFYRVIYFITAVFFVFMLIFIHLCK